MEGPQSDADVKMYREMAGKIGDRTVPVSSRLAALEQVKTLWQKYDKSSPTAPAAAGLEETLKGMNVPYEPSLYEYRVVNGKVQRKKK